MEEGHYTNLQNGDVKSNSNQFYFSKFQFSLGKKRQTEFDKFYNLVNVYLFLGQSLIILATWHSSHG